MPRAHEKNVREIRRVAVLLTVVLLFLFLFSGCTSNRYSFIRVDGESMLPALTDGEIIIIDQKYERINRGDIIVLTVNKEMLVKRVMAIPRDHIEITDGEVFVNGVKEENATETDGDVNLYLYGDEYFVLGDNREVSKDSRYFGAIKETDIIGVMVPDE